MEVTKWQKFVVFLLVQLEFGNAQFYGSYGHNSYLALAPITFPQAQSYSTVPLLSRVGTESMPQILKTSSQISSGSELFSFDMFYVS